VFERKNTSEIVKSGELEREKSTALRKRSEMVDSSSFTTPCVPKFDGDYDHWSLLMENLLRSKEYWTIVETEIQEPKDDVSLSPTQQKVLEEAKLKDLKAKNYLFQAIDKIILKTITQKNMAKQ